MWILHKQAGEVTPEVYFNKSENEFRVSGRSIIEYPQEFYHEVLGWVSEYAKDPNNETTVDFEFEYFNTPSAPFIKKLIETFLQVEEAGSTLKVRWKYEVDDEDMEEIGRNFENILNKEFEFVEI